jgi:Holliday junction resolvase-like predicted endonuclease
MGLFAHHLFFSLITTEELYVTENQYQAKLIRKLKRMFPGIEVLKQDPSYQQGMLDLILLYRDKWASLEVKKDADAEVQPNQGFFVRKLNKMSFASYIYPENEEEVLNALQQAFEPPRRACVSKP